MHPFHFTLRLTRLLGLFLLIGSAVAITIVRFWLLPQIDVLKFQLAEQLSRRIGQPVHIGHFRASMHGLTPQLRLLDVRIGHQHPLRLEEIQLVPDLVASVRGQRLQFQLLRIVRARIKIQQDEDGRWRLLGLGKNSHGMVPAWLLRDGRFELIDTTLILHRHLQPSVIWQGVGVCLSNHSQNHELQLHYRSAGKPAQRIEASVRFQGGPGQQTPWQGRFLVLLQKAAIRPLATVLLGKPVEGKGDLQVWGHWQGPQLALAADFDLRTLRWPHFQDSLAIGQAAGTLHIRGLPQGWQVQIDNLHLTNRDLNLATRVKLKIPRQGPPHLEALGQLFYLDLAHIHAYLPSAETDEIKGWLRDNLKGSVQGKFLWRGRLVDFPFEDRSGVAEARLVSHNTFIRFHPGWPAIHRASVRLHIHNDQSRAILQQGQIGDIPIRRLSAELNLASADQVLQVRGTTSAQDKQIFSLLERSPLQNEIGTLTRWVDMKGSGRLDLQIQVPLRHGADFQVVGRARIEGPYLRLRRHPVSLEPFRGTLHFDRNTVEADIRGQIRHQPAQLHLASDSKQTEVTLHTAVDTKSWPTLAQIPRITGTTEINLDLLIPHDNHRQVSLQLESDLAGLSIDHPYPLGKKAEEPRSFQLHAWLGSGEQVPFSIDYPPFHGALMWHAKSRSITGRIGINQPPPSPYGHGEGLFVQGRLERLHLDQWLNRSQPLLTQLNGQLLQRLELNIDRLYWRDYDLGAHQIRAQANKAGWQGQLRSKYTRGKWALQKRQLDLRIDFLDLGLVQSILNPGSQSGNAAFAFTAWPAFHLDCKNLRWHQLELGQLNLRGIPQSSRLHFDFRLEGQFHHLEGSGSWQQLPVSSTKLSGRFQSRNLGKFLQVMRHESALVQTPTNIDFQLRYAGPPYGFELAKLQGYLNLQMGPGRWLSLEPGAGRLLGLLYLGTLQRRLRLDFSDLFARGLSYERIHGHIRLAGGHAFTDDLLIEAVPARIFITGSADLNKREIDETVLVVPNTPLTLGFFPQQRGAASIFQRLFNAPLDTLMQSQYAIYGSWDNPAIVRVHRSLPGALLGGVWSGLKKLTTGKNHEDGQRRGHSNEHQRPAAGQSATGGSAHQPSR